MNLWKEYSLSYVKNNKASTISILTAAFVASVLLSFLCGIFYNIWVDDIHLIKQKEGEWHAKITADLSEEEVKLIEGHPDVERVVIEDNEKNTKVALLYFYHARQVYEKLPVIANQLGLDNTVVIEYHDKLLARYFVFAKNHNPPLVLLVYLGTLLIAGVSLILVIHNAFGVSMIARLQQLAILQSIGATPRQLRRALVNEAVILSFLPLFLGAFTGVGLCYLFMNFMKSIIRTVRENELIFQYHPGILLLTLAVSLCTVWVSALLPASKLSRLSPLEAIRYEGEQNINRMRGFDLISRYLGIEGELARKSLYSRRRAFRTATISLTLSFLVFSAFLNLNVISSLSTGYTFFERYKDVWDLMLTVDKGEEDQTELLSDIRKLQGVKSCISYQKVAAYTELEESMLSDELVQLGGLSKLIDTKIPYVGQKYRVNTPIFILDDQSYYDFCVKLGAEQDWSTGREAPDTVVINTIWNNSTSNRRYKKMIPFIRFRKNLELKLIPYHTEDEKTFQGAFVNMTAASNILPGIREELENFSLTQIMSESTSQRLKLNSSEKEYYTILVNSEKDISSVENNISKLLKHQTGYILENKYETVKNNVKFRNVYMIVIGSLAGLLVCIGLANVLSNALGLVYQRKREFSRYLSIGLTPKGILKLLMLEASILAVKPILLSLLVNVPLVLASLNVSLISLKEFLQHIPALPILVFATVIIVSVETAYYIGGKRIFKLNLVEALRDDTLAG